MSPKEYDQLMDARPVELKPDDETVAINGKAMPYYELKHQCLYCDSSFIVLTERRSKIRVDKTFCPLCGATGTCLRSDEKRKGDIDESVPGESKLSQVGLHIQEQCFEDGELRSYSLKKAVRLELDLATLLDEAESKKRIEAWTEEARVTELARLEKLLRELELPGTA